MIIQRKINEKLLAKQKQNEGKQPITDKERLDRKKGPPRDPTTYGGSEQPIKAIKPLIRQPQVSSLDQLATQM
jgi:hypothetical protein